MYCLYASLLTWPGEGDAESDGDHLDVGQVELGPEAEHHMLPGPTIWVQGHSC